MIVLCSLCTCIKKYSVEMYGWLDWVEKGLPEFIREKLLEDVKTNAHLKFERRTPQ